MRKLGAAATDEALKRAEAACERARREGTAWQLDEFRTQARWNPQRLEQEQKIKPHRACGAEESSKGIAEAEEIAAPKKHVTRRTESAL